MSANEKMVMVPRQWAQQTVSAGPGEYLSRSDINLLSEALNQAAQQGQGEPVAMPARMPEPSNGTWHTLHPQHIGWNACLDEIAKLGPLYTSADPAEVERLRADYEHAFNSGEIARGECDVLRTQLAELRESMEFRTSLIGRYEAQLAEAQALLASAYSNMEQATNRLGQCISCGELPEGEDEDFITHISNCTFCEIDAALSASAEPSAPVEIDERADFENWGKTLFYVACFERDDAGSYVGRGLQGAWLGWQARAALARKP